MNQLNSLIQDQNKLVAAVLIIVLAYLLSLICKMVVDFIFRRIKRRFPSEAHMLAKTRTIRGILKNMIDAVFLFTALLMLLAHFGFNILPLITGASILGLAFSFGAQTLFKDMIAGFFIVFEDQFSVGDKIKVKDFTGTVYKMTLRMTVLKDEKGNFIYLSNSQIENVTRFK